MKKRKNKISGGESRWPGPFKKRRGGVVLTKEEVKEIKAGRKKLRREMKAAGIRSRKEFELTASAAWDCVMIFGGGNANGFVFTIDDFSLSAVNK